MKNKIVLEIIFIVIFIGFTQFVIADGIPLLPCSFYGDLIINGEDAPIDTTVVAKIDGEELGSITTTEVGKYGGSGALEDKLLVSEPNSGDLIIFYVNDVEADQTATWVSGGVINLDLSASGVTLPSNPPSNPPPGPGPSGGSSGGSSNNQNNEECTPQWSCAFWSKCSDGTQTRICSDFNNCEITEGKPSEIQSCTPTEEEQTDTGNLNEQILTESDEEKPKGLSAITGAVVGALGTTGTGILIVLVIVFGGMGGYFTINKRKKK